MLHSNNKTEKNFPLKAFSIVLIVTLIMFIGIGIQFWVVREDMKSIHARSLRMQELTGIINHLDEVLTMSALMGAETGNTKWEKRYLEFEPKLDNAIKEAEGLAPDTFLMESAVQTDVANIKLVAMEKLAFDLVRQRQNSDALAILFSDEYEKQKRSYTKGIEHITTAIRMKVKTHLHRSNLQTFISIVAICIALPILIISWIYVLRLINKYNADKKLAEETLRGSEERVLLLLNSTGEGIYGIDLEGNCTFANLSCLRLLGYKNENQLLGQHMHDLIHHTRKDGIHYPVEECCNYQAFKEGKDTHVDDEVLWRADGTSFEAEYRSFPIFKDKATIGSVVSFVDITERKRLEEEIMKSQKLESLGILAGGIAHDFNNYLQGILNNITLALAKAGPNLKFSENLEESKIAIHMAKNLTKQLLTFSKGGDPIRKVVSLSELIRHASKFAISGSNIKCELSVPECNCKAEVDYGQINQAFNNIIVNAIHAMPNGGIIMISADRCNAENESLLLPKESKYVKIMIKDQGTGMPQKHLQKIFDPYFTTKETGSGLGLSVAFSIIKKHNGYINVESEVDVGTTFYIYIPATEAEVSKVSVLSKAGSTHPKLGKGKDEEGTSMPGKKILYMDDDGIIRLSSVMQLRDLQYEVEDACDGTEVIKLYKEALESGNPFDAVVLDLTVPDGMGGEETIKELLKIDPEVTAIVASGYSDDPVTTNFGEYGFKGMVQKPFEIYELEEVLQKVILGKKE